MPAPNLGPSFDLAVRLKRVEDALARMAANPLGQAFSSSQSDGSVGWQVFTDPATGSTGMLFRQGTTTARDPATAQHSPLLYVGEVRVGGSPANSAVLFYSTNGNERGQIGGSVGTRFLDDKGNIAFNTDEASGEGLAEPWLTLPMPAPTGTGSWPKTNATSWGTVAWSQFRAQHPKVWWVAQATADPGSNGSVQLQLSGPGGATVTGPSHPMTGGSFITTNDVLTLPAGFWGQMWSLNVQCEVTSGTGNVYCQTLNSYGIQS